MSGELASERIELAPSETRVGVPVLARVAGAFGLCAVTGGVVSVIAAQYGRGGIFGEGGGYLLAALGLACLFLHAVRDADVEVRRAYAAFAAALLLVSVGASVVPGGPDRSVGYYLLPWGTAGLILSLLFAVPFARHEDDPAYLRLVRTALLAVGGLLCVGSVAVGVAKPDTLVGPGALLALIGLGYLIAYLGTTDSSDGTGYWVAVGLGALGATALFIAFAQSVFPTVLHEGPAALKTVRQTTDKWAVTGRVVVVLASLAGAFYGVTRLGRNGGTAGLAIRAAAALAGLGTAAVFVYGSFSAPWTSAVPTYFVPYGLLLGGIGSLFLLVAVGVLGDVPLVVLTRRELASYFYSPIAYAVLFVMTVAAGIGYALFLGVLREGRGEGSLEPVLQNYLPGTFIGPLLVPFLVPALTMRLFSEERRTGTLEVLLTAPVTEWAVAASKFLACWAFFLLCWVPAGLFLVGLRVEGGSPFDYRPLLSFYGAVAASGAAFVAVGMLFSCMTRNQIVAAVLTFAVMLAFMVFRWTAFIPGLGATGQAALGRLSYWMLWNDALKGQLPVRDLLIQASVAALGLFLTVKLLEARKWG